MLAKRPDPGRVKTRLTPALTPQQAAEVHAIFVQHLAARLVDLAIAQFVICHDPPDAAGDFRALLGPGIAAAAHFIPQPSGDLGQRIAGAIEPLLPRHARVLVIGADMPDLPESHLRTALGLLADHPLSIGPTGDGGYWCFGATPNFSARDLLADIHWSSGREYDQTLERARRRGIEPGIAPAWQDVDQPDDLAALLRRLAHSSAGDDLRLLARLKAVLDRDGVTL